MMVAFYRGHVVLSALPPAGVMGTIVMGTASVYLGGYTGMLGLWYLNLACRGQFSLARRRALNPASQEVGCTTIRRKYDLSQPCSRAAAAEMFSQLRYFSIARR